MNEKSDARYVWWRRFGRWAIGDWWIVRRSIWPYRDGYATFNKWQNSLCDTGLTKERAQELCREMNYGSR